MYGEVERKIEKVKESIAEMGQNPQRVTFQKFIFHTSQDLPANSTNLIKRLLS